MPRQRRLGGVRSRTAAPTGDSVDQELEQWTGAIAGLDPVVEGAHLRVLRLGRQLESLLTSIARAHGLSEGDWETLSVLQRAESPLTPTALATALAVTSGTMSVRLQRLQRAGLITCRPARRDGRSRAATLTPAGRRRWRAATGQRIAVEASVLAPALATNQGEVDRSLRRLLRAFESAFGVVRRRPGARD